MKTGPSMKGKIFPQSSLDSERIFLDEKGRLFLYVPATYLVGNNQENGCKNYRISRAGNCASVARRIDADTGEDLDDAAGLDSSSSILILEKRRYARYKDG